MRADDSLADRWAALPAGARGALEEQWRGVAAGALPSGAAIVDEAGGIVASGRNHCYDPGGQLETRRW